MAGRALLQAKSSIPVFHIFRWCAIACGAAFTLWAVAALYFDVRVRWLAPVLAVLYGVGVVALLWRTRASSLAILLWYVSLALVTGWWFTLAPTPNRNWQTDVAELAWAEVNGRDATIHNIRNCDYVTEMNYSCQWETKTVDIESIRGVDLFLTHWGAPLIAHAMASFSFADGTHLAFSIEARKAIGQDYSALRGFFRQYELIYVVAEERDLVRVRANYRTGENVYLYHTATKPSDAHTLFLRYLQWINENREHPRWYNALTNNCGSSVISYLLAAHIGGLSRWDWRRVLLGYGDKMLYDLGDLQGNLPFAELKRQALINPVAQQADKDPQFSRRIREGRAGFD